MFLGVPWNSGLGSLISSGTSFSGSAARAADPTPITSAVTAAAVIIPRVKRSFVAMFCWAPNLQINIDNLPLYPARTAEGKRICLPRIPHAPRGVGGAGATGASRGA